MTNRKVGSRQNLAREAIKTRIATHKISLRRLSRDVGFKSHASLSNFLSGSQDLTIEAIEKICLKLGLEGLVYDEIMLSLIDKKSTGGDSIPGGSKATKKVLEQLILPRYFFNFKLPIIREALKIMSPCTSQSLVKAFNKLFNCRVLDAEDCLVQLAELNFAEFKGNKWYVCRPEVDFVIPAAHRTVTGKNYVKENLSLITKNINDKESSIQRSLILTLPISDDQSFHEYMARELVRIQDHFFSLQTDKDTRVVNIMICGMELAKKTKS